MLLFFYAQKELLFQPNIINGMKKLTTKLKYS